MHLQESSSLATRNYIGMWFSLRKTLSSLYMYISLSMFFAIKWLRLRCSQLTGPVLRWGSACALHFNEFKRWRWEFVLFHWVYRDPEWPDVKLAQACYLLSWLVKFKESIQSKSDSPPLLVITGDYNSLPGDQVPRYHLPALQLDCKFLSVLFDNPHIWYLILL